MNIIYKKILLLFFVLFESCTMAYPTATTVILHKVSVGNYIFCINNSYYVPFYTGYTIFNDEVIKTLCPDVITDTLLINENECVLSEKESIFFANDIEGVTKSTICDAYINGLFMCVNIYNKDGSNSFIKFSLQPEELQLIVFLKEKLEREKDYVYIDSMYISTANYQYMLIVGSEKGDKIFFISGNRPNEPLSCAMLSDFIMSLVQNHLSDVCQNNDKNMFDSAQLRKCRTMLKELEKNYGTVAEQPPIPEDFKH